MYDLLRSAVEKHIHLTAEEFEVFSDPFYLKEVKKKQQLLRAGEICKFEGFVNKGCFRVYYLDDKGDESILCFAVEGWWITVTSNLLNVTPTLSNGFPSSSSLPIWAFPMNFSVKSAVN